MKYKMIFVGLFLFGQVVIASSKKDINWNPVRKFEVPYPELSPERISLNAYQDLKDKFKRIPDDKKIEYFLASNPINPENVRDSIELKKSASVFSVNAAQQMLMEDNQANQNDAWYSDNPMFGRGYYDYSGQLDSSNCNGLGKPYMFFWSHGPGQSSLIPVTPHATNLTAAVVVERCNQQNVSEHINMQKSDK